MANVARACVNCGHWMREKQPACKCPCHRIWREDKVGGRWT